MTKGGDHSGSKVKVAVRVRPFNKRGKCHPTSDIIRNVSIRLASSAVFY